MKKFNYLIIFIIFFFAFTCDVNAQVKEYTRSSANMLVPSDVIVDNNNSEAILKTPAIDPSVKIYDYIGALTQEQIDSMMPKINQYIEATNIDIAIVITDDLRGFQITEYTYNFYDYNDFLEMGVTFVIYTGGAAPEIFMGNSGREDSEIFKVYTESRINNTLAYVYNKYLKSGDYYNTCDKYVDIVRGYYANDHQDAFKGQDDNDIMPIFEILVIGIAITFIIDAILIGGLRKKRKISRRTDTLDSKVNTSNLVISLNNDNQNV